MFVDSNNQVLPLDKVIRQSQKDVYGKTYNEIITPTVVAEARKLFGCPTLSGVPLENEGGNGTASAHWEYRWAAGRGGRAGGWLGRRWAGGEGRLPQAVARRQGAAPAGWSCTCAPGLPQTAAWPPPAPPNPRLFQGELMLATVLFSAYGGGGRMSPLTLALLQDTGWYDVNMTQAGYMEWGRGAGCGFVADSCWAYMKANPSQPYFCNSTKPSAPPWPRRAASLCPACCMTAGGPASPPAARALGPCHRHPPTHPPTHLPTHAPNLAQARRPAWWRAPGAGAQPAAARCTAARGPAGGASASRRRHLPHRSLAGSTVDASSDQSYTCTFTSKSQGYCRPVAFADGCAMVQSALVGASTCARSDRAYPGSDQFGWINGPNSRCYPVTYRCAARARRVCGQSGRAARWQLVRGAAHTAAAPAPA
jgi:hypothetical protein